MRWFLGLFQWYPTWCIIFTRCMGNTPLFLGLLILLRYWDSIASGSPRVSYDNLFGSSRTLINVDLQGKEGIPRTVLKLAEALDSVPDIDKPYFPAPPKGGGRPIMVYHAGSSEGFVPGDLSTLDGLNSDMDYHKKHGQWQFRILVQNST